MDAFNLTPPPWTDTAIHAHSFGCPTCHASPTEAKNVWINRRSPVFTNSSYQRKWQEFYQCQCGCVWWGWSSDRPPSPYCKENSQKDDHL